MFLQTNSQSALNLNFTINVSFGRNPKYRLFRIRKSHTKLRRNTWAPTEALFKHRSFFSRFYRRIHIYIYIDMVLHLILHFNIVCKRFWLSKSKWLKIWSESMFLNNFACIYILTNFMKINISKCVSNVSWSTCACRPLQKRSPSLHKVA